MTIDEERCLAIVDAVERPGRDLRVTFNYRYAPHHSKLRELILNGTVGDVFSVHFEWLLNTQHGADYFRRWHRDKRNSGGLLVHKSTHHFDLVNFWLDAVPLSNTAYQQLVQDGTIKKNNIVVAGLKSFMALPHAIPTSPHFDNPQFVALYHETIQKIDQRNLSVKDAASSFAKSADRILKRATK